MLMTEAKQLYLNNSGILILASEAMLSKIEGGGPVFFTISVSDLKQLLKKAIEKDSGRKFDNCEAFFIPNSYIEIHVEKTIPLLIDKVAIQIRRRADDRGLNIFISESKNEISHSVSFQPVESKEEYYNEVHIKTKHFKDDSCLSVQPI